MCELKRMERLDLLEPGRAIRSECSNRRAGSRIELPQQADEVSESIAMNSKGVTPEGIISGVQFSVSPGFPTKAFGNDGL